MTPVDYVLIAIVIASVVIGAMRGFLREVVALITWLAALFIAWKFSGSLAPHLGAWLGAHEELRTWVARTIILVTVLVIGAIAGGVLSHFVKISIFSGLDRFLGLMFGALRGLIIVGLLVIFGQLLRMDAETWWKHSVLVPYATHIANGLRGFVGEHWPPEQSTTKA